LLFEKKTKKQKNKKTKKTKKTTKKSIQNSKFNISKSATIMALLYLLSVLIACRTYIPPGYPFSSLINSLSMA
jgi:hypothetical protein